MSLNRKLFIPSSPPTCDDRGYPIDYYGRVAVLSEEPYEAGTERPVGPPLARCSERDCYKCLLWVWDVVATGQPGGSICGYCGKGTRFPVTAPPAVMTCREAAGAKKSAKLQLGAAQTLAEKAAATEKLVKVGEALLLSMGEMKKSLERSYQKQYLLNFAIWESEGCRWSYGKLIGSIERSEHDEKFRRVNQEMYDTNWEVVIKEIVHKIVEIKEMRAIIREVKFLAGC